MQNKYCLSLFVFCTAFFQGIWSLPNPSDICSLKSDSGPCFGYFKRFSYNSETGKCKEFTYGGCEGNRNNFVTKEACETACDEICSLYIVEGLCKMSYKAFGFDKDKGKCVEFEYGGCAGNGNRFSTQENCQTVCEKRKP